MAYRLLHDEPVQAGIRRIVLEQIDKAIEEIHDEQLDRHEAVHQIRKRCKKIRGVLRLVRPRFEDIYRRENAWFRDAAANLSAVRDAEAIIETFDKLREVFGDQVDEKTFDRIRQALVERRQRIASEEQDLEAGLSAFAADMGKARERVQNWSIPGKGFAAVAGGLQLTYRRGRRAMAMAYRDPTPEQFHEWRKRVKYHRYHTRLLQELWQPVMETVWDQVKYLSDLLGDDHDLAVFRQILLENPKTFGSKRDVQMLIGLIDRRRTQLQHQARPLGEYIYAEKPKAMSRRLGRYWQVRQAEAASPSSKLAEAPAAAIA